MDTKGFGTSQRNKWKSVIMGSFSLQGGCCKFLRPMVGKMKTDLSPVIRMRTGRAGSVPGLWRAKLGLQSDRGQPTPPGPSQASSLFRLLLPMRLTSGVSRTLGFDAPLKKAFFPVPGDFEIYAPVRGEPSRYSNVVNRPVLALTAPTFLASSQ